MISPAYPAATACGLMTAQVQLVNRAVGLHALEKKRFISAAFCWNVLGACTAFLILSEPKAALIVFDA